ncbi:MAG: hypothetical protein Q8R83_06325 [Legionellaceae bacterium]|nr:hypothetical protein [Legionellaceae bacterium]
MALSNLGRYLWGKEKFIDDNTLKTALFDFFRSHNEVTVIPDVLQAISYCHPKNLTHDEISDLIDLLVLEDIPIYHRDGALSCLLSLFHLGSYSKEAERCFPYILNLFLLGPLRNEERNPLYRIIGQDLVLFLDNHCKIIAPYLISSPALISQFIDLACTPQTYCENDPEIRSSLIECV